MSINAVTYLTGNTTFETGMVKRGTMGFNVKPTLSGSFNWWNKVDALSTQYLIYTDSYTTERTTQANAIPTCWSTPDLNDTSFVNLVNTIPERIGQLPFTAFAPAYNWLTGTDKYVVMKDEYENIVTDGLVLNLDAGWYNSYPATGTVWTDLSSAGNNGTLINGPAFQSNGQGSLYFDNTDDYVRVNESASVDITSNQISFGAWVYPTVSNKYQHILVKNVDESRQYGMWLSQNGTSQIFRNLNGVVTQTNVAISTPWVVNQWNHIYLVYNGSTIKIYLNGSEVFTENASGNIVHTNSNVNIGGEPSQPFFLNGNIGSAQIYNIALTPSQVLQNFNTQKYRFGYTPPFTQDGLALYLDAANPASYPGNGTTWYDLSEYTRNGTLVNGVGFSSLNGGYLIFDGSDDYISNISNTGLNHGTDNFSYFAWVNLQGKPSLGTIFENGSWTSCLLIRYETNVITIYSMGQYWGAFSFNPSLDTWNHLGFVRNGNFIDFYVNGVYQTALGFTANISPSPNIFIGTSQHATNQCFNGYISVAQIYTKALTTTEITEIFNYQKNRYGL